MLRRVINQAENKTVSVSATVTVLAATLQLRASQSRVLLFGERHNGKPAYAHERRILE